MSDKPFLLGLTGSIGMGKSTTAQMFADLKIPVWDADEAVRRLYAKGGAAVPELKSLVPNAIKNDAVNKAALKKEIAHKPDLLERIETVVHPLVAKDREDFITKHQHSELVVLDIPLLFETGGERNFDAIVVVSAPADIQKDRVLARGTMTEATFEMILGKQMPDAEKRKKADYIVETLTLEGARQQVQDLVNKIRGG